MEVQVTGTHGHSDYDFRLLSREKCACFADLSPFRTVLAVSGSHGVGNDLD